MMVTPMSKPPPAPPPWIEHRPPRNVPPQNVTLKPPVYPFPPVRGLDGLISPRDILLGSRRFGLDGGIYFTIRQLGVNSFMVSVRDLNSNAFEGIRFVGGYKFYRNAKVAYLNDALALLPILTAKEYMEQRTFLDAGQFMDDGPITNESVEHIISTVGKQRLLP